MNSKGPTRYKLICVRNDDPNNTFTITKESCIKNIDHFIYNNKIRNIDDLYDMFINMYWQGNGTYTFKIIYKYKKEVKEKNILFYHDIEKLMDDSIIYEIQNAYLENYSFQKLFNTEFLNPILRITNNQQKIKQYAIMLNDDVNEDNFLRFLYAIIMKKLKYDVSNCDTISEMYEVLEANNKIIDYTKLRNVFSILKYSKEVYYNPSITISKFYNEFEELQEHDQNPDLGIRNNQDENDGLDTTKKDNKKLIYKL